MKRDSYLFANFFLGITAICSLFQTVIFFRLDAGMGALPSFLNWIMVTGLVQIAASIFVLKYYYYKKYQLVFVTGIIITVAGFWYAIMLYMMRLLETVFYPSIVASAVVGVLYGIGLIFSKAGERTWLRMAGIVTILNSLVYIAVILWFTISPEVRYSPTVLNIWEWHSFLHAIIPMLFIMNFLDELKNLNVQEENKNITFSKSLMALAVIGALILPFIFAFKMAGQTLATNELNPAAVKLAQTFEARTYVNSIGDTMSYRLLKPLDYDSTKKYPLVVCLHGGAGWGTDNIKQLEGSVEAQILSSPENRKKYPAFLFVPQCPPGTFWGGRMLDDLKPQDSVVFEIIDSLENEFAIDSRRLYVMGHSLGGYGAWHFICSRPKKFAAAVPMAGEGDATLAEKIIDVPIWAFHGRFDRNVPVSGSRNIVEASRKAGGNPKYTEYPYNGHSIWGEIQKTPELMDWVFAQKRE
jgi:predicted esterase